ncbi:MAG: hypothetical protein OXF75_11400 [Acidimicrobiaceae bacterium]|nr:hypothetical protein [Acidimicrobiaceae bacterium]MCY3851384.1 hypothetical protein [Acidimicrobiaceae bacterium]
MSETMRLKILDKLASMIGEEEATQLMENVPPFDWHEIATKDDLAALKEWAEAKFDAQSASIAAEFTNVRGEIAKVEGNLSKEIGELHQLIGRQSEKIGEQSEKFGEQSEKFGEQSERFGEQSERFGELRQQIGEMQSTMADQGRANFRWMVATVVSVVGAAVGSGIWLG